MLIGEVTSVSLDEEFAHEKLSPVLAMYRAENFEQAMSYADQLIRDGGYGHTASLYVDAGKHREKIDAFAAKMKACRIVINTPSSHGGIGDLYNFNLAPSLTLGCGSWGGNSVSENVGVKHLLNIKTVAERRENMLWFRTPQKVYFKKGCLPVALREIQEVLHRKRAFLVTDQFLFKSGMTACITDRLQEMGVAFQIFSDVQPDPTLSCAKTGAALSLNRMSSLRWAAVLLWMLRRSCGCCMSIRRQTLPTWQCASSTFASAPTSSRKWAARRTLSLFPPLRVLARR